MKNAVCIKQVPAREWRHRLSDSKSWIEERDVSYEVNEPAAYALEEALRLRDRHSGDVAVCAAGPMKRQLGSSRQTVAPELLPRSASRAPLSTW